MSPTNLVEGERPSRRSSVSFLSLSSEIIYRKIASSAIFVCFFLSYGKLAAGTYKPAAKWYSNKLHKKLAKIGSEPFRYYYHHRHIEAKCTIHHQAVVFLEFICQLVPQLRIPRPAAFLLAREESLPDTFASLRSNIQRAFELFCFYCSR